MNNFVFAMSLALWLWGQLACELVVFTARRDLAVTNAVRVGPLVLWGGGIKLAGVSDSLFSLFLGPFSQSSRVLGNKALCGPLSSLGYR